MDNDTKKFLSDLLAELQRIDYVRPEDIPNIDLYMDQITTFMDSQLETSKRHADDKILTKTMINNYAKNNLLPPPEKKKYTKEHVLTLIFIYYFKNILSISDIQSILNPITDKYFGKDGSYSLEDIYREVFGLEHQETQNLMKDPARKFNTSCQTFPECCPGGRRASAELQSDLYVKLRCLCEKDHHRASDRHDHIGQVQDGKKQKIIEKATGTGKSSRSPVALFLSVSTTCPYSACG